jgi:hypothetical protein
MRVSKNKRSARDTSRSSGRQTDRLAWGFAGAGIQSRDLLQPPSITPSGAKWTC